MFLVKQTLLGVCRFATDSVIPKPVAVRSRKQRSSQHLSQEFIDSRRVRVTAGRGGDGCVSFLRLWVNDTAGPDGGDGGHGGHVIFQASSNVSDLKHVQAAIQAENGEKGFNKDCFGRNAKHTIIPVPIGTVVRDIDDTSKVLGDLSKEGLMFVAARGGAGGHGNHYFVSDTLQAPHVAECGAEGESKVYYLEVKTMAHIGLLGMPNAGKSTLLRAISRARPKVAPYPFTTLKPHVGIVHYDDYEQIAVADLPGLIEGSSKNRGLGHQFLQHAERCAGLLFVIDLSITQPWQQIWVLQQELDAYSKELAARPLAVAANKIDLDEAQINLAEFEKKVDMPVIPISAKTGQNINTLLNVIRAMYDRAKLNNDNDNDNNNHNNNEE